MKRLYIILGIIPFLFAVSCSDYFDQVPTDRLSLQEIFSTRNGVQRYLAGVYTYIPDEFNQRQTNETEIFKTYGPWTAGCDEAEYTMADHKAHLWNNNTVTATENNVVSRRWKSWYTGIHEATVFMDNVYKCPTSELSLSTQNQYRAEARALRAIYYFYLVRAYGPVPLIKELYSQDTPPADLQLPRNTSDECFDYIISELRAAKGEGMLEHASQDKSSGPGRIDQTIAQAFIVEALTFKASWLFNGSNSYYADMANPDGTKLFPQNLSDAQKKARWQEAATEAKRFIDDYVPRFYQLESVKTNGKHDPYLSYRAATRGSYNQLSSYTELIFYRIGTSTGTMQWDRTPFHRGVTDPYRGGGLLAATQEQVDAYYMDNGLPAILGYESDGITPIINPAAGYDENGTIGSDYKDPNTGQLYTPAGCSKMYYKREPRFYADITFSGQKWLYTQDYPNLHTSFEYSGNAGKKDGLNDYTKTGYLVRKCAPDGPRGTEDRVCVLMRLPSIYFNYVEALNEYDPNNPDIVKYLNIIRERAGIPLYGNGAGQIAPPATAEEMKKAIVAEKRIELSFENYRFFDVRRWGIAKETQGKAIYGMNIEGDGSAFYRRTKVEDRTFEDRQYFFPIPQGEIDIDKNLVQNKGY